MPDAAIDTAIAAELADKPVKKGDTVIVQTPWKKPLTAQVVRVSQDGRTADLLVEGRAPAYDGPVEDPKRKELPHNLRSSPRDDTGKMPDSWRPV